MTLQDDSESYHETSIDTLDSTSSNWDALYCSHLWSDSNFRRAYLNKTPYADNSVIKYCYTCRGKIRKYELKSQKYNFVPNNYSTPNGKVAIDLSIDESQDSPVNINCLPEVHAHTNSALGEIDNDVENQCIPTISRQIDSSFRQKYTSYDMRPSENPQRLRKSLKGIGCVVNFALTESPVKKRTQIQACSISVMIVAIVVISFVLVNFTTPSFTRATKVISTIVVPTSTMVSNETSSAVVDKDTMFLDTNNNINTIPTTENSVTSVEEISLISNISMISKIRKNIRTYPKNGTKLKNNLKPKDIINRDVNESFCSCQMNEVCMLDENSGTSLCKKAVDLDDPTGCGGLCALETEACHLVDRARGVRVCRLLTLVTCSPQEWRCRNGLCVPMEARCDGAIQCYDRSDEMHCDCDLTKHFRCGHSISCFPNSKLCDGVINCWDGFDEVNCTAECPHHQFTCTDGQCITSSRFCDGLTDCADGSDEPLGCGVCSNHETTCKNHRCVSKKVVCDGQDNCGDNSDELDCSSSVVGLNNSVLTSL